MCSVHDVARAIKMLEKMVSGTIASEQRDVRN
jgi:hypothetical protein